MRALRGFVYVAVFAACSVVVRSASAERVTVDYGGSINMAISKGFRLQKGSESFVIDGRCYSACTLTADIARPKTCLRPGATLFFHRRTVNVFENGKSVVKVRDMAGFYSPDIRAWITGHGGLPISTYDFLTMPYDIARTFFRACTRAEEWG